MKISQKNDLQSYMTEVGCVLADHHQCCLNLDQDVQIQVIPNLNVISKRDISTALLWELFLEYRCHRSYIKTILSYIYCIFILLAIKLNFSVIKKTKLALDDQYPAILGGNNRIRLISSCNQYALIHAINTDTKWSCASAIDGARYYSRCTDITLPKIMPLPCGGYLEEQVRAIALNRTNRPERPTTESEIRNLLHNFFVFQELEGFQLNIEEYFDTKRDYIAARMTDENLSDHNVIDFVASLKESIISKIATPLIDCVWSHGDLNRGNVLISDDQKIYIIDWEYFGIRHKNYDKFIYHKDIRHAKSYDDYKIIITSDDMSIMDLLEEYIFCAINGKANIGTDVLKLQDCKDALITQLGK